MKRVLVTAIGGDIGQTIAQCIKNKYDDIYLLGTDVHDKHGGSLYVDDYITVPAANDSLYLDCLIKLVSENDIDVIIPVNESELKVLVNGSVNLNIIHCSKEIINIGLDKLKTIDSLESFGIEVPWTIDADKEMPKTYPCIMKPRSSSGSKSIFIINSNAEAKFFSNKYPGCVFQELLDPYEKEITCGLYRAKDGQIESIQFERVLVGGLTGWARVVRNKSVKNLLNVIAKNWNLEGSINVQLRITKKGPMIFEINPRFSSTVYMRHKLGFTDVIWSLKEFFNKPINLRSGKTSTVLVRTQNITILSEGLN